MNEDKKMQEVLHEIKNGPHQKIKVAMVDTDGILRGKLIHRDKFLSVLEGGFGFCNVVFGWDIGDVCYTQGYNSFTGPHTGFPDANASIDLNTFRKIPWENGTPFFLSDFEQDPGPASNICSRTLFKRIIQKSEKQGFYPKFAQEYEWFNFRENAQELHQREFRSPQPLTPGMFGYSLLRTSQNRDFFHALFDLLAEYNIPIEGLHTETGPGVYEAAILYDDALAAADKSVLFKAAVKEIAHPFGIMPSFMAKWNATLPGCSGHLHQSLWDEAGARNLFYDQAKSSRSKLMDHYIAGQLHCLPYLLPLYAPTINSYKRFVEGYWAPTTATWARDNRTTSLRILGQSEKSTRIELRVPGADVNPYLAMAAALASGLYGIEKKLALPPEGRGSDHAAAGARKLAKNLNDAVDMMESSPLAAELLGKEFCKHFIETRRNEWAHYQSAVTDWELKRYFEIV
jgi:glutamine synthetase